ncbi:hypothetical protein BGZ60DRAFT_378628 [Tricladium varicosporioides]|nr:hypothetical protein BGZ60DRAFT_378628 [Hymenoscyphus varicosporioides]
MEPPYNFPQDDYALAILTHAAMQTNTSNISTPRYNSNPASGLTGTSIRGALTNSTEISNQHRNVHSRTNPDTSKSHTQDPSSTYNSHIGLPSSARMETLSYSSHDISRHNSYMDSAFRGIGSEISRNYANNLGILNAESYDAEGIIASALQGRRQQQHEPAIAMPFGFTSEAQMEEEFESREQREEPEVVVKRKKRTRIEASADDDEDGKKKSRGRPRVDTKDETAADRRRTQIRMAQRAYRNRKESTISSLEKQVQELRGTNEEMSNIFISLYDFAVGKGLLQREPEFGQQLQATTERFLALAKAGSEDPNEKNEDSEKHDPREDNESGPVKKKRTPTKRGTVRTPTPPVSAGSPVWGGYQIDKVKDLVEELQSDYQSQAYSTRGRSGDLQIITRPTEDNASFPFDFDTVDLQQYRVEVPSIEDFSQHFLPFSQPPVPASYSYSERSFARRLQRAAMEGALKLITMEDPPAGYFQRVFGLTHKYEDKKAIEMRLRSLLGNPSDGTLQNWKAPFVHIGGAGTYYPSHEAESEELMPKLRTGYSMGPFSSQITELGEEVMDDNLHCKLKGFEGEFFDPNDVEGYLQGRGLEIPPAADYVTVQVDFSLLAEGSSTRSGSTSTVMATLSPRTPKSPGQNLISVSLGMDNLYNVDPNKPEGDSFPFPAIFSTWENPDKNSSNIEPSFLTIAGQDSSNENMELHRNEHGASEKKTITLNVQTLLKELISRGVCLGRSPGFRPSDVNTAILAAARAGY